MDSATEAATGAVDAATDAATDAVNNAVDSVTEAASDAVSAATDTVTDTASEAATETATETATEATEAVAEGSEAATPSMIENLLSVEGFDLTKVSEMIENSDLGLLQKTTLTKGLEAAQDNPELLGDILAKIREALNI